MSRQNEESDSPRRYVHPGRVVFYVVVAVLVILLALVVFSIVITRSSGNPPSVFGYSVAVMESDSMEPRIPQGAAVLVQDISLAELQEGDVLTYKEGYNSQNEAIVGIHRIQSVEERDGTVAFRTKGDNSPADETLRTAKDILGKAVMIMPAAGKFLAFVKTPFGLVVCIAVPLVILLILEITNLIWISRKSTADPFPEKDQTPPRPDKLQYATTLAKQKRTLWVENQTKDEQVYGEPPPLSELSDPAPRFEPPSRDWELRREHIQPVRDDLQEISPVIISNDIYLNLKTERDDSPLERIVDPPSEVAYTKPLSVPKELSRFSATQEFSLSGQAAPGTETLFQAETKDTDFAADVAAKGRNHFKIEGVDVRVRPDVLRLSLGQESKGRDISIMVTRDYTNVTVGSEENELNFALFRDETDDGQKVIIQRKSK